MAHQFDDVTITSGYCQRAAPVSPVPPPVNEHILSPVKMTVVSSQEDGGSKKPVLFVFGSALLGSSLHHVIHLQQHSLFWVYMKRHLQVDLQLFGVAFVVAWPLQVNLQMHL
ncbi:hypothetical protein Tco_0738470 [Tanacetum coccineum]